MSVTPPHPCTEITDAMAEGTLGLASAVYYEDEETEARRGQVACKGTP